MSRGAVGALAKMSRLATTVGGFLPGRAGEVARITGAALDLAKELAALGADDADVVHITRVQDIRRMVEQAKADKN